MSALGAPEAEPLLVLGATSLIGRFVPAHAEGRPLLAVSREPPTGADAWRWTRANLRDPRAELPAAKEALALCPVWLLPPALPALERAGVRRLVAVSSTSRWTKERSPHTGERETARRLAEGEDRLLAWAQALGAAVTVLRPTLIYAEGLDANVSRLASLARRWRVLPIAGRGRGRRQPVHADDLARGVLQALASAATAGRAYDLPGGETLTYAGMCRRVFEGLGLAPRLVHLPPPVWAAALWLASPLVPGATGAMGARMDEDLAFDGGPARRDFGWAPRPFQPDFRVPAR